MLATSPWRHETRDELYLSGLERERGGERGRESEKGRERETKRERER